MPPEHLLDDAVQARMATLRRAEDRWSHATGAVLADALARAHGGPDARVVRRRGKAPVVQGDAGLYISVAHGGSWVAVAVTAMAPVGIDVEPFDRELDPPTLAEQVLAPSERALVAAATDPHHALLSYWTRKEAVVKATGDGLRVEPRTILVSGPGERPALLAYPDRVVPAGGCTLVDAAPDDEHVGAIAVLTSEPVTVMSLYVEHPGRG